MAVLGLQSFFSFLRYFANRRVSSKKEKTSPRIVFRCGKQDNEIKSFLAWRKRIRRVASYYYYHKKSKSVNAIIAASAPQKIYPVFSQEGHSGLADGENQRAGILQ